MKLINALNELNKIKTDSLFVEKIELQYKIILPDNIRKIISLNKNGAFYDDLSFLRALSHDEIVGAAEELLVDFIGINLLPIFDSGDNDFIVFDLVEQCWYKFNIVDEIKFSKALDLSEYLRGE